MTDRIRNGLFPGKSGFIRLADIGSLFYLEHFHLFDNLKTVPSGNK